MKVLTISCAVAASAVFSACMAPANVPSVKEPIDSSKWTRCAEELRQRESNALVDDIALGGQTLLCEGVAAAGRGEIEKALELLTESSVEDKKDYRPHYMAGRVLAEAGRYEEALTAFERSYKRYDRLPVPSEQIGRDIAEKKDKNAAIGFLETAEGRKLCPYGCKGLLASLYRETGQVEKAEPVYRTMVTEAPEEPAGHMGLAAVENSRKSYAQEAARLEAAIASKKFSSLSKEQKASLHYSLAFARYNSDEPDAAANAMDEALILNRDQGDWYLLAGWIEMKRSRTAKALVNFEKAAKLIPSLAPAHEGIGDAALAMGNHEEAIDAFRRAHELDPENGIFILKQALAVLKAGDTAEGKQLFQQALEVGQNRLPQSLVNQISALVPPETAPDATSDPPAADKE